MGGNDLEDACLEDHFGVVFMHSGNTLIGPGPESGFCEALFRAPGIKGTANEFGADVLKHADIVIFVRISTIRIKSFAVCEFGHGNGPAEIAFRSEEHTSELQSLMRTSYTV